MPGSKHYVDKAHQNYVDKRFQILEYLGKGAAAKVYRAWDRDNDSFVAIKILHSGQINTELPSEHHVSGRRVRWRDTLKISLEYICRLSKPDIKGSYAVRLACTEEEAWRYVEVEDVSKLPYLVIELLGSQPEDKQPKQLHLGEIIDTHGHTGRPGWLPIWDVLEITNQWLGFLDQLHSHGMNYPDQKLPHTFWNWEDRRIRVIDYNTCYPIIKGDTPPERAKWDLQVLADQVLLPCLTGMYGRGTEPSQGQNNDFGGLPPLPSTPDLGEVEDFIPTAVRNFARSLWTGEYTSATKARDGLKEVRTSLQIEPFEGSTWTKIRSSINEARDTAVGGDRPGMLRSLKNFQDSNLSGIEIPQDLKQSMLNELKRLGKLVGKEASRGRPANQQVRGTTINV